MAKVCRCHQKRNEAMAQGMDFYTADKLHGKPGYHEHRCECNCGCTRDTLGYGYCPACHFDHAKQRGESIGILGIPFKNE